jgi:gliding motility-associated-like protein
VVHPASPAVYDTLYCLNGEAIPLRADSTGGHRLQWYGVDTVPVPSAPVPATDAVGVFSYFVAQVDTLLGCEGDKSELKVTIEELPDTLINAHAPDICRNTQPVVTVGQTYDLYTYTLFNRNNDTLYSTVATGSPLDLYSSETLSGSDTLFVEIQNQHQCTSKDRSIVPVRVEIPDVPEAMDTTYCMGESAAALYAVAAEGYAIQWHDLEGNPVGSAPVPPTDRVDTLYYNVTQKHATLGCESDTVRVRVIVTALPDTVVAVSPDICPGRNPVIEIEASDEGYIYNVYSASNALMVTAVGSGDSLLVTVPETIYETAYYYVETVNLRGCASDKKARVETVVLNYMYLMPDKIPQYQRDKLYSVQLETNAVSPYEIYTEDVLPFGFSLSPTGLISGVAPRNGLIDPVPFTVKVSDVNGCFAEKEYVLESHLFIPQAFTPNGDGHNDVFMKGRRLVIFDRLGLKIYEGDNGWDGSRLDGAPAPPDTYFYLIYYEDENLKTEGRKKGYITLIRRK